MYRSTLPPSYLPKEHALDTLRGAIFAAHLSVLPQKAKTALNPNACDAVLLDTLSVFYSVDYFSEALTQEQKRAYIFNSIFLKRIKGTYGSVKRVLEIFDANAKIIEQSGLHRHNGTLRRDGSSTYNTYSIGSWAGYVVLLGQSITLKQKETLELFLRNTAPARCRLLGIIAPQITRHDGALARNATQTYGGYING